jgi:TLD
MTKLTTLSTMHKLEERYPFNLHELAILVRCHEKIIDAEDQDDFLMKLALASPYSYYFLPGCEMRKRVNWIEEHILPPGFANELRAAMTSGAFVEYANQGESKDLERFIEGVACTGRRGVRESLGTLYDIVGDEPQEEELVDCAIRLSVANEALMAPNLDKGPVLKHLTELNELKESMGRALKEAHVGKPLTKKDFTQWAETHFSLLSAPLSAFVHNLVFHGNAHPEARMLPYVTPKIEHASEIFTSDHSPLLIALSFISPSFGGKWHRLYSSEMDGRSFNRLEWSLLGYAGPTLLVVKTTDGATLGGFTGVPWHEDKNFYGNADSFLVELAPNVALHRPTGTQDHFMYLHSEFSHCPLQPAAGNGLPHGIGFGGTIDKPRFFIPHTFEGCTAGFLCKTFESGELVPPESLEKFELKFLEVWGVGGDEVINKALRERAEYRERTDTAILKARIVQDKTQFADDMKSGLIPNNLFSHMGSARGRPDFKVDEAHGGYKIEK